MDISAGEDTSCCIKNGDRVTYKECLGDSVLIFVGMANQCDEQLAFGNDCVVTYKGNPLPVVFSGLAKVVQAETNLLPCPFCGSTDISEGEALSLREGKRYKQVGCTDCGALGPVKLVKDIYDNEPSNKAWNVRT